MGSADPLEKWMKNIKVKTCKKEQFSRFVIFLEQSGQAGVENGAMLTTYLFRYGPIQNAPFRSQIFKIFFASGGKRALTLPNQNPADAPEWNQLLLLHAGKLCQLTLPVFDWGPLRRVLNGCNNVLQYSACAVL